jgi:hypothetical protein
MVDSGHHTIDDCRLSIEEHLRSQNPDAKDIFPKTVDNGCLMVEQLTAASAPSLSKLIKPSVVDLLAVSPIGYVTKDVFVTITIKIDIGINDDVIVIVFLASRVSVEPIYEIMVFVSTRECVPKLSKLLENTFGYIDNSPFWIELVILMKVKILHIHQEPKILMQNRIFGFPLIHQ